MKKHVSMEILTKISFYMIHANTTSPALRSKVTDLDQDISTLSTAGIKLRRRKKTVTNPPITQQQHSCSFYPDILQQTPYHLNYNQRFFLHDCINSSLSSWLNKSALNTLHPVHFTNSHSSQSGHKENEVFSLFFA